jgi:hypothetical protein
VAITFTSESGDEPIPAGIDVVITLVGGGAVGSGTTDSTGTIAVDVTQGVQYHAAFTGTGAPADQDFWGGSNNFHLTDNSGNYLETDDSHTLVLNTGGTTTVPTSLVIDYVRVTQAPLEVLAIGTGRARITQDTVEVLAVGEGRARATQITLEVLVPVIPADRIVTQTVLKALVSNHSDIKVTQTVLKSLVTATTPAYNVNDFVVRLRNLLPKPWWSKAALQPGGLMYVLLYGSAFALTGHKALQLDYIKNQTRILTASGANLDNISLDYLGTTLPRLPGESDASFRVRLIEAIIGPKVTLAAMQAAVNLYFSVEFQTTYSQRPTAYVFDRQSDPTNADIYNIEPPQFVIQVNYPIPAGKGWVLGQSNLGYATTLGIGPYMAYDASVFDPGLVAVVNNTRAEGTKPVYLATQTPY